MPHPTRSLSRIVTTAAVLSTLFVAVACDGAPRSATALSATPPHDIKVVDVSFIDTLSRACDDFFQYAVGAWLAHDTIPDEYSSSGVEKEMNDNNEAVLHVVLDDLAARRTAIPADSATHKLGVFYASCMDSLAVESEGYDPLRAELGRIDSITSTAALVREIALLHAQGIDVAFGFGPAPDPHDAAHYLAWLAQGGLGLPDRDYYLAKGASADSTRVLYRDHIARYLIMTGADSTAADGDAARVLALETELARASVSRVALRTPAATDHPMTLVQVTALAPEVDWVHYLETIGADTTIARLNVAEPAFVHRTAALIRSVPLETWQAYLRYHAIAASAPWLDKAFVQENFRFSSHFSGAKQLLPRWKRCLHAADAEMGDALGEAYVQRVFPPEARERARAVIQDVRTAFGARLKKLTWMSDSTRTQALTKLARMGGKIGYPDKWRDYGLLHIANGPFATNMTTANAFEWHRTIGRPGKPIDLTEWEMTVPTINAYYDGTKNEMVFPGGALMPQTFDPKADLGANYGSLAGSWAGHELTHGFDDEGRHYDAAGNLRDWWTAADSAHFAGQAKLIVDQYNGYLQVDTFHVNGALTEGENIADFGGVLTGYDALEAALARQGRPGKIDGFTPEQRYFLGYAQSWREHVRDASLKTRVTTDPHSPDRWRTNGPLSNDPQFAAAFSCKPGDRMVRDPKSVPEIW
ncbi:MAG TPA: M13 family metallopeptidase [Gemmatimonadales bacterium]